MIRYPDTGYPTDAELRHAYQCGTNRHTAARLRGGQNRYGWTPTKDKALHTDRMSAMAEAVVAKALGRGWTSHGLQPDNPNDGDVEGGIDAKWVENDSDRLIVQSDKSDSLYFALVVGRLQPGIVPKFRIAGYMSAIEAKQSAWWNDTIRFPAFMVPATSLHTQDILPPIEPLIALQIAA